MKLMLKVAGFCIVAAVAFSFIVAVPAVVAVVVAWKVLK